jgi:hypothetical protein
LIKDYRNIWIVSLIVVYSIVFFYKKLKGIFLDELILFHFMLSGIMLLILSNKKINMLMEYLKQNYFQKWEYLNTYPIFGRGFVNAYRVYKFARNKDNFEDQKLLELKKELIELKNFSYIVLFSPILGIIASNL